MSFDETTHSAHKHDDWADSSIKYVQSPNYYLSLKHLKTEFEKPVISKSRTLANSKTKQY